MRSISDVAARRSRGAPTAPPRRTRARPGSRHAATPSAWAARPRQPRDTGRVLRHDDRGRLEEEVGDEVGEDQPGERQDRIGGHRSSAPPSRAPGTRPIRRLPRAPRLPRAAARARRRAVRSSGRGPGRPRPRPSPGDTSSRAAASDRRSPSTRISRAIDPLPRRSGRRAARARSGAMSSSSASVGGSPLSTTRPSRRAAASASRSRARRNAGPVRCVAGPRPGSTSPATTTQRIGRRVRVEAGAQDRAGTDRPPGASRPWSSSPWVNSKSASRSAAGIAASSSAASVAQPGRRARRVAVATERRRRRSPMPFTRQRLTACLISRQWLTRT